MFNEELFLTNETSKHLYHTYAEKLPIIDYHCHLLAKEIYEDKEFEDLGEMWLAHDHYKWRAMRTFGIDERFITGDASYYEKFMAFAAIVPQLIGNPIYIWCALELKRYFGIEEPLSAKNAEALYNKTKALIKEKHMTPSWCMQVSNVEVASTTEDPADSLEYHHKLMKDSRYTTRILSAYRPDKAFYCEKASFSPYLPVLGKAANQEIISFATLMDALETRLLAFKEIGTMISDAGIESFTWAEASEEEVETIFQKAVRGEKLTAHEEAQYKTAFLLGMAELYHKHGFVMQLHIGTYQGANKSKEATIGVATGFDCTDDNTAVQSVGALLDTLTKRGTLPKTILYPLNAVQIETFAILAAAFCEGGTRAKVQLGAPWWFNDQAYGINRQFEAIANLYPISLSVGMLTDSRSFLSYPRHELYRRVLCNYLGILVERGEYFSDEEELAEVVHNICYANAKEYFGLE
ncbi:glucuronate isomerase [Sporanaerobium hydrogeniformans]|uniref:Glucuronate isomerase n=1 Tax=Sporanaerobium hydrogeniformans TaxID=3072179 RepID=A0AC61DBG8_9FIRM|nr:glucuronate isomerase [Sporanaerobium hydrogeniformans]PHV70105.1 glucuronate isomerase [Sporanaerobium hydrogeniformans]